MKMRKWFLCATALLMTLCLWHLSTPVQAAPTDGNCAEGTSWWYYPETKTLEITGWTDMPDYDVDGFDDEIIQHWSDYIQEIEHVIVHKSVTGIGAYAFAKHPNLKTVTIAESVTFIGANAFIDCPNLETVQLPSTLTVLGVGAFQNCNSLRSIVIPDGVQDIYPATFDWCTGLEEIVLPAQLKRIHSDVFHCCENLVSITLPASLESIDERAFADCGKLWHVLYLGSESQWGEISVNPDNVPLLNANIHYGVTGNEVTLLDSETCTHLELAACSICGEKKLEAKETPTHSWDEGVLTKAGTCITDGEHIRFQSDLTSHYVLAQVEEGGSLTWLWIVLAVVALAGGGAAGYFFWFKKRKTA